MGTVYPRPAPPRFNALKYIADYFNAVEVNVSFYRLVPARMSAGWVKRVPAGDGFRFAFKVYQGFTHQRDSLDARAVSSFLDGVQPLAEAGLLGCLLIQFPWSFRCTTENQDWIRRLAGAFGGHPQVAELRHDSWDREETLDLFRSLGMGFCNIDQPSLGHCMRPTAYTTSRVGYVRLHGRRADKWFAENVATHERYDYHYSEPELREWKSRIDLVRENTDEVYVFANNHHRGQGPANALQLRSLIEGHRVRVPEVLVEHYPDLSAIQTPPCDGQSRLF